MMPLVLIDWIGDGRVGIVLPAGPVRAGRIVEIVEVRLERTGLGHVFVDRENARRRMRLGDVEESAGLEIACDEFAPWHQIVEPAENAVGGEDDVERSRCREMFRQIEQVRTDEVARNAGLRAELSSGVDGDG